MSPEVVCGVMIFVSSLCYVAGYGVGLGRERNTWKDSAAKKGEPYKEAHVCDGKRYRVIEEDHFLDTYVKFGSRVANGR